MLLINHNPHFANAIHHQYNNVNDELMKKLAILEARVGKLEKLLEKWLNRKAITAHS